MEQSSNLSLEQSEAKDEKYPEQQETVTKTADDEATLSEGSISEHITSASASVENDRSFQEIEIMNQPSVFSDALNAAVALVSQEQKPNSLDLSSFGSISNGLPVHTIQTFDEQNNSGSKNAKSILEEILSDPQFYSDRENSNSNDESFNLFANVNLSDRSLINLSLNDNVSLPDPNLFGISDLPLDNIIDEDKHDKHSSDNTSNVNNRVQQLEEIVAVKDTTINALSQELDSFREMSNPTFTSSMVSATEYKQLQEDCHVKLMEYNSAIIYKDDLIQQLSESLDQSVSERKTLLKQIEQFKEEVAQLQEKLQETAKMVEVHQCHSNEEGNHASLADNEKMEKDLPKSVSNKVASNTDLVQQLQDEVQDLKNKIKHDKSNYDTEVARLRDMLENIKCGSTELMEMKTELEKKHAKEVEELRTYFEKKCAELEKNYSEEVFSQQSRKLSGSSSEADLSNDYLLSNQPGPGGDHNKVFKSKEDVEKFKETLASLLIKLGKHSLEDITQKGLANIEDEVKNELSNMLKIGEKLEFKAIESKYLEEISNLKFQLDEELKRHGNLSINSALQEVASSGDYELNEVVESYERRLQDQITLAKVDLMNALEIQIQMLVSKEGEDDDNWAPELLQLRDKFSSKYERQIQILKEEHAEEIAKLKEEHLKMLNGALDRARRRSSLKDDNMSSKGDTELSQERDSLKKQVDSLRNLLSELVKYITQAEDELNNTLVENLIKQNDTLLLDQLDEELNNSSGETANSSKIFDSLTNKARVHLTPNFGELITMIENQSRNSDDSFDVSLDLKNELGMCLEKLKQEANTILALSAAPKGSGKTESPAQLSLVSRQLLLETRQKEKLREELMDSNELLATLEREKEALEGRVDELLEKIAVLEADLEKTQYQIAELIENGRSEVVSEGYGEEGAANMHGLGDTTEALRALQERARSMLTQTRTTADPNTLQLIEDLCRICEKIKEEAKKESQDLMQQIEAADKKYKTTQKFLEEQAVEREQERDDAQKRIDELQEQLKEREKDRTNCEIMASEAEQLERHIVVLTGQVEDHQLKYKELEEERDEAVEKIKILRDVIKDLEQRNDLKDREIETYIENIEKLECIVNQQDRSLDEFNLLRNVDDVSDIQSLRRHCDQLEEEVQQLRIGAELAGNEGAAKQIKLQLFDIEVNLDRKTRELELLHTTDSNSCSSHSEDMSVRDLVRPQTPGTAVMDECEVPLQQLARLKEKLLKHGRAEEAAIKRIHDLEMQVSGLRTEIEEANNEKELLNRQIHEQLVLISDFQIRLDQQRIKAEHIEKQTNTSLETKIYDLQSEIVNLQEKLRNKDKSLHLQEQIVKETQERLRAVENEMATAKEDEVIVELQKELEVLRDENRALKQRATTDNQILPNLVENILQDKNNDIEKLKEKLKETEDLLYDYTSLNIGKHDLKTLANLKRSGGSIEQLISVLELSQSVDQVRRYDSAQSEGIHVRPTDDFLRKQNETPSLGCHSEPEISSIDKIGESNLHYTLAIPLGKPNSTEINHKSNEKRVHFEDSLKLERLTSEIGFLKNEITAKNEIILDMNGKIQILNELEDKIAALQSRLDETEQALTTATVTFEKEQKEANEREQKLVVALAEKKMQVVECEKEIQALEKDSKRKDDMYLDLAREKKELEERSSIFTQQIINEKNATIEKLQREQIDYVNEIERVRLNLENLKAKSTDLIDRYEQLQMQKESLEKQLAIEQNENEKLKKDIDNKVIIVDNARKEVDDLKAKITENGATLTRLEEALKTREETIKQLQEEMSKKDALIIDKDCDIEILNEDLKYYQTHTLELENAAKSDNCDLKKELADLQEIIREKDRVIVQMSDDQKKVHSNLKIIDNQIKQTGNYFDLYNRLKDEQKKNADLYEEIHKLKAQLFNYEATATVPVEEIAGQVKKELECAAQIDSNIMTAVNDHSFSSISEGQDAEVYMKSLSRQKSKNKQLLRLNDRLEKEKIYLEKQCNNLKLRLDEMQSAIEKETVSNKQTIIEDARLIKQLRIRLESALDLQEELEKLLQEERHSKRQLESQLEELKKPSSSSESTKYKSLPTQEVHEISYLKKELKTIKEEKEKLTKENKTLTQNVCELENNVKYTKEMLMLEAERNRAHEQKFKMLIEKEKQLSDELLRKKFELELKEKQFEENKIKLDELEQEKHILKKQKNDLLTALKVQPSTGVASVIEPQVPDSLANLITELKQKSEENKKRLEYIEQIENEKRVLETQLRNEVRNNLNGNVPFEDLVARCNYLFAKSLKLESFKKALIWQKRYLLDFVASHQKYCFIEVLPSQPHANHCLRRRHTPKEHFRALVYVVISIERMKFLVRRWHTGTRKYQKINERHYQRSRDRYLQESQETAANFQVGQPVSNQNFAPNVLRPNMSNPFNAGVMTSIEPRPVSPSSSGTSVIKEISWSGNTPPSKDNVMHSRRTGLSTTRSDFTPLRSPQLLTQLHERVEQIQEKLSLSISADHT